MTRWLGPFVAALVLSHTAHASILEPISKSSEYVGRTDVHVDLSLSHPISDLLYGVFFEEIQHSGEGGIYAELIQDRSFEGMAWVTGFLHSEEPHLALQTEHFQGQQDCPAKKRELSRNKGMSQLRAEVQGPEGAELRHSLQAQPDSWQVLPGTQALLTRADTVNADNPVAMRLVAGRELGGLVNTGYWGIPVQARQAYSLRLFLKFAEAPEKHNRTVRVALESGDSQTTHASVTFSNVSTAHWHRTLSCSCNMRSHTTANLPVRAGVPERLKLASAALEVLLGAETHVQQYEANLTADSSDLGAQLRISFPGPAELLVDVVSLFPLENVAKGALNPYPFRPDLLQYVKDLNPRFLRIPGGCVIEGDTLALRFQWKKAIGPIADRPGHWDIWGYWNTDGLGMFEYLQMADELNAIPIWVANNGVAHQDEVATKDIGPWVQDALDSLEFAMGPANSTWGKVRAAMGREEPWHIPFFAIGNEDCGPTHPYYLPNYVAFYFAIKQAYPNMTLIANCQLGEMWDWHLYTNSWDMYKHRGEFDSQRPGRDPAIFASEYAVVDDSGFGNLKGALAEAAVMIGMERNSEVVRMAAYAPLLVNEHDHWYWTNLIGFNGTQVFGIPSYHVQKLFSEVVGVKYVSTQAASDMSLVHTERVAAGATCQDEACTDLAVKIVNTAGMRQDATIYLKDNRRFLVHGEVNSTLITGQFAEVENSLEMPRNVHAQHEVLHMKAEHTTEGATLRVSLPPISLVVLRLNLHYQTSPSDGGSATLSHLTLG